MSDSKDSTLSACGCCQGLRPLTPQPLQNLPGLSALVYSVGTHGSFKETMLTDLTELRGLGKLTSRDDDDPSIALIDASAAMLDVLTFYQERIINEGYLQTAVERRSVLELARQIGYELAPGVAASTYMAFILEGAAGAPGKADIPIGTRVQSLPEQGQTPQSFETVEAITAYAALNKMTPKTTELVLPGFSETHLYLKGISNNLRVGDALLIVGQERIRDFVNENWDFRRIKSVTTVPATDPERSYTLVTLEYGLGEVTRFRTKVMPARDDPRVYVLRQRANLFGHNAPDWKSLTPQVRKDYCAIIKKDPDAADNDDWPDLTIHDVSKIYSDPILTIYLDAAYPLVRARGWAVLSRHEYQEVYQIEEAVEDARACLALSGKSTRLVLRGEKILDKFDIWLRQTVVFCQSEELTWAESPIAQPLCGDTMILEKRITGLLPKRTLIVSGRRSRVKVIGENLKLHQTVSLQDIKLEKSETMIVLQAPIPLENGKHNWHVQNRAGWIGTVEASESEFAFQPSESTDAPVSEVITVKDVSEDQRVRIQVAHDGLELQLENSSLRIALKMNEILSLMQSQISLGGGKYRWHVKTFTNRRGTIEASKDRFIFLPPVHDQTEMELEQPLTHFYDLTTVEVYGNVAPATHGETNKEVLGSGDASRPFQKFVLKNSPLAYVPAANPSGSETTLKVHVDDVLWKEADSFYGLEKRERVYITRRDDEGKLMVEFGDGLTGVRPSSGNENISAVYRVGTGAAGMVKAGQLSLLMSQILGVQKVTNPLVPTGAADPESRDQARQNAPFTVMTLGRVVSLQDFEDFARAFAGIGKAQAEWLWDGESRVVHLTIAASTASAGDYRVPSTSILYKNLRAGIDAARDTTQLLLINTFMPLSFRLKVRLLVNPDYTPDKVIKEVLKALKKAYSFNKRIFGQSVSRAEVMALIQGTEGVEATFVDALFLAGQSASRADPIPAHRAHREGSSIQPAELLVIDPSGISVEAIQ